MRKRIGWRVYLGVAIGSFALTGLALGSVIMWRQMHAPVGVAKAEVEELMRLREQAKVQRQLMEIDGREPEKKILIHANEWSEWVPIYDDRANIGRGWRYRLEDDSAAGTVEVVYVDGSGDRFTGSAEESAEDFTFRKNVARIRWKMDRDTMALIWFTRAYN